MNRFEKNKQRFGELPEGTYLGDFMLLTEDLSGIHKILDTPLTLSHFVMVLVLEGEAELVYDSNKKLIRKHDFLIFLRGHQLQLLRYSPNVKAKVFYLDPPFAQNLRQTDYFSVYFRVIHNPVIHLTKKESEILKEYYSVFEVLMNLDNTARKEIAIHMLKALMYIVSQFQDFGNEKVFLHTNLRDQQLFSGFMELFKKDFKISHDVSYYADKLCITSNYLSKITIRLTGKTLKRWINETLINQACIMLETMDKLSIKEISDSLGYSCQASFCRCFKGYMGMSPNDYKKIKAVPSTGIEPVSKV